MIKEFLNGDVCVVVNKTNVGGFLKLIEEINSEIVWATGAKPHEFNPFTKAYSTELYICNKNNVLMYDSLNRRTSNDTRKLILWEDVRMCSKNLFIEGFTYKVKNIDDIIDGCDRFLNHELWQNDEYVYMNLNKAYSFNIDMSFLCGKEFKIEKTSDMYNLSGFEICPQMCEIIYNDSEFVKGETYIVKTFDNIIKAADRFEKGDYRFHEEGDSYVSFTPEMRDICGKTFVATNSGTYTMALGWFLVPKMCVRVGDNSINFTKYVHEAMRTKNEDLDHKMQLLDGACGLAGEAGEVVDAIKKYNFQGHQLDKSEIENELGDVLWYVALICDTLSIDLEDVARRNLDKLRTRYPKGFSSENSLKRIDKTID